MARWIRANGEETVISPKDAHNGFSLQEIYIMLKGPNAECGPIDIVWLDRDTLMVCRDDAYREELPFNRKATLLFWNANSLHEPGWWIRGDVLVGNRKEIQ
jgi:hypothetical protein